MSLLDLHSPDPLPSLLLRSRERSLLSCLRLGFLLSRDRDRLRDPELEYFRLRSCGECDLRTLLLVPTSQVHKERLQHYTYKHWYKLEKLPALTIFFQEQHPWEYRFFTPRGVIAGSSIAHRKTILHNCPKTFMNVMRAASPLNSRLTHKIETSQSPFPKTVFLRGMNIWPKSTQFHCGELLD